MIRLFSPEAFRDYLDNQAPDSYSGNGSVVLTPTECTSSAEIDGVWQLTLTHPYDEYSKYSYIQKNCVIVVDAKVAREQQSTKQAFRVMEVRPKTDSVEVMCYPVAWESIYEVPLSAVYENRTADELVEAFNNLYSNKYHLDKQFTDTNTVSVYVEDSNLQEMLNGDQDGTFKTVFDTELVYDNYTYRIMPNNGIGNPAADAKKYKVLDAVNITGVDISESTVDMVTRIIPESYEGYKIRDQYYIDCDTTLQQSNPFVYAKIIKYDDICLVDEKSSDDYTPETKTQYTTKQVKAKIVAAVRELSEKYLRMARNGEWAHNYDYGPIDHDNPHDHNYAYSRGKDRASLPYGYLFYSYTDAIGVLTERVLGQIKDENEYNLFADAIKEGFKWCETTEIAGWDWRYSTYYADPTYNHLNVYHWIEDESGWYYGDGAGDYLKHCWIEDSIYRHYWVGDDGYWDSTYDDWTEWDWHQDANDDWWYGSTASGNYAREQYMYTSRSGNWYWFGGSGIWDDGSENSWWYGTEDGSDVVKFGYHKVGNHIWWFDAKGAIDPILYYIDSYRWMTDEVGYYYGDGNGHWMKSCWIEDSDEKHYWVNAEGYWDAQYDDTHKWAWQGGDSSGWWYGFEGDDESTEEVEVTVEDEKFGAFKNVNTYLHGAALTDSVNQIKNTVLGYIDGLEYTEGDTVDDIHTICDNSAQYQKSEFINAIQAEIDSETYDYSQADDYYDTTDTEEETVTTHVLVYAKSQYMYVSENNTWYYFDDNGYLVAAWVIDDNLWDWKVDAGGWWYGDGCGSYPDGQWMKIDGKWYFFDTNGYADKTTDDFEEPKAGESDSATYDSNREGIGSSSTYRESSEDASYDATREGVRAWIQDGFVDELQAIINECDDELHSTMEDLLRTFANIDLSVMSVPSLSITIDFAMLANTRNYEKYTFLKDLYLGDHVYVYSKKYNMEAIERITSIEYDCIKQEITKMTFETTSYKKKGFIPGIAKQLTNTGKIIKYNPQDAIEDGYGGFLKTGYGVNLTTL
jgi:hypothetical protein